MGIETNVEYLIVDTSAFIKNVSLQNIGNKIITEPSVVDEIKSKRQLRRLVVLPYDLDVKEAHTEDIKFVTEFSKKTGDYGSLSATDIKVIALTYRYEKEKVGTSHLKEEPEKKKEIIDSSIKQPDDNTKNLVGFYSPDGNEEEKGEDNGENSKSHSANHEDKQNTDSNSKSRTSSDSSNSSSIHHLTTTSESTDASRDDSDYTTAEDEISEINDLKKKFQKLKCDPTDFKVDCENDLTVDDILKPVENDENEKDENKRNSESQDDEYDEEGDDEEEEEEEDGAEINYDDDDVWLTSKFIKEGDEEEEEYNDDDNDGWITPKNITSVKKQMDSGVVKEKPATVACLTMDYAMQNVLMQIGLNVASIEGKVIKEMRTFILRCYSCFQTTGIVTKLFCPHCGHKTLKKVAVTLDDEGKQKIHINFRKPLTSKGKKFSLPTYQGGKHACNPILFEDQPMPDQRPTKLGRAKNDPLKDDYIAGYSPFIMRDVNSRAAMLGIKSGSTVKHWMRRNPNEAKKHRK